MDRTMESLQNSVRHTMVLTRPLSPVTTELQMACMEGNLESISRLLRQGADPLVIGSNNETCIHIVTRLQKSCKLLVPLIQVGVNLNVVNIYEQTALHILCEKSPVCVESVKMLLENGADPYLTNGCGQNPLQLVAAKPQPDIALLLSLFLKYGVNINFKDRKGKTALHLAALSGTADAVLFLLRNRAKLDMRDNKGRTPFHLAAKRKEVEVLQLLLSKPLDINDQDYRGWTALHHAAEKGFLATAECLLQGGAKVLIRNYDGQTALHLTGSLTERNEKDLVALLGENLEVVNLKDNKGYTALHYAVRDIKVETVRQLLECSAYVDARHRLYGTSLLIISHKHIFDTSLQIIQMLLKYGASLDLHLALQTVMKRGPMPARIKRTENELCKQMLKMETLLPAVHAPVNNDLLQGIPAEYRVTLEEEVEKIKSTKVTEDFTLYDLVTKANTPSSSFLLDAGLVTLLDTFLSSEDFLGQFPEYGYCMRTLLVKAKRSRIYLMHLAVQSVFTGSRHRCCEINEDSWLQIFSYLSKDDLVNFTMSG